MLGNARHLQQTYSQAIDTHSINSKLILIQIIIYLLPITLFTLPAIATEPSKNNFLIAQKVDRQANERHRSPNSRQSSCAEPTRNRELCNFPRQSKDYLPNIPTPTQTIFSVPSTNLPVRDESIITPGRVRLMTKELEGLIERFETTLLTAQARHSDISTSTVEVIQEILNQPTATRKQNLKQTTRSQYRDAYRALHRARQGLKSFHSSIDQRYYDIAQAQWSAARQALWDNYPSDRSIAQSEIRGMWLDRGTIVKAKSAADLVPIFDRMATAGINTVFFETVNSGYTIYPSQIAPKQNPLVEGWDPLKAAIELAHERGMELHAWVWTFAAVNQRHNVILDLPRNYLGPVLTKYPDWGATDAEGSRFHYSSGKVFFDPANPDVQHYLSSLFAEIATNYEVDGIHLDYIRYPFQSPTGKITYGYGKASRAKFMTQTGFDPMDLNPNHPLWSKWTNFKIEQIDNFVSSVAGNLRQLRPDLTISTAVFPMPKRERLSKIQQNWETWVEKEWVDMLIPMTYAKDTERLHTLVNPLVDEFKQGKALLLPGIRLLDISEIAALDQIQLLRGMSTEGYALFAAENLNSDSVDIFNRTQGDVAIEPKQPLPHREPFRVTLNRYEDLQKEWNFFLLNNRYRSKNDVLTQWGEQADRLAQELQKLADEPSNRNFFSTQITLNSLRRQFPRWMKETKGVNTYQAEVWQNRLDTLDRLLSYGEKKMLDPHQTATMR